MVARAEKCVKEGGILARSNSQQFWRAIIPVMPVVVSLLRAVNVGGHAVIKMAHALGLSTVAEGVETVDELRRLQALGCDFVQGFYFAAALPAAAIDDLLARRDAEALLA